MRIYADNAATTKLSERALRAMLPFMNEVYGNPSSLHSEGQMAAEALSAAREKIASLLNAQPSEIIFTSGGSEADTQAIFSAAEQGERKGKKHIISTAFEHHAVLHALGALQNRGFEVTLLPIPENGIVTAESVGAAIREDTCLVTVMYANNEIGTIQPVSQIGAICREKGVPFHTDAVQAAGYLQIDVRAQNIDLLSASAHKFHGPKGIGFLYVRKGIFIAPIIYGGAQERGRRAGTENLPAVVGMAQALSDAAENRVGNAERLIRLRDRLIEGLSEIPHSVLNGDATNRLPGNVHFCFEGIEGESLLLLLDDKGISASSGSACTSGSLEPSHVLLALGRPHEIAHGSLRLTLSEENTENDVTYIVNCVREAVEYLRGISPVWRDLIGGARKFIIQ